MANINVKIEEVEGAKGEVSGGNGSYTVTVAPGDSNPVRNDEVLRLLQDKVNPNIRFKVSGERGRSEPKFHIVEEK